MDNNYDEIGSNFIDENLDSFDLLIVTATKTEKDELHQHLKPLPGHDHIIKISKAKHTYYLGVFGVYAAVHVACNDMGAVSRSGSITTTMNAIAVWKPKAVLMVGIAFGISKAKQKIGDVLISERVIPYESQRVGKESISRAKEGPASSLLVDRFNSVTNWPYTIRNRKPQIIIGPVLSGEKLIDNVSFRDNLLSTYATAIGGEMEGSGIYAACDDQVPHWIMVKGICDFADGNKSTKKSHNQKVAISSAVSICEHVFNSEHAFEDIPLTPSSYVHKASSIEEAKKKVHEALDGQVKRQIKKQINSGKYIPNTFIEIGQHKDLLRYLSDPVTFAEKCLNEASVLDFSSLEKYLKKRSKEAFGFQAERFIYNKSELTIGNIQARAIQWSDYLNQLNDKIAKMDLGNECSQYSYKLRENLLDFASLSSRVALITEMPGQGKTNFVCDFAENFLMTSDIPALFLLGTEIDPRDIRKSIINRIYPDNPSVTFEGLMSELQAVCEPADKSFVIIIDGLNENGSPKILGPNLESFISEILEYHFVRIILTCRTEYYNANFSLLERSSFKKDILKIDSLRRQRHYDDEVSEKLFRTYMDYFKIDFQVFSAKAYGLLVDNFLLLRIYCDSYQGTNVGEVDNIYKEELFTRYFEVKSKEINDRINSSDDFGINSRIDIQKFILNIVEYMVSNDEYSNIPLDKIMTLDQTSQLYTRFLDENILVRRDLQNGDSIFGTGEVINFTFDEFRDFLISRYLITKTYQKSEREFKDFLNNHLNDASPIQEGCGTFLFHASRKSGNDALMKIIEDQTWYDKIFKKEIFNLKDEFISETDRNRLFNDLPTDRYNAVQTIKKLMKRTDISRYVKLNIQHLFEYLRQLDTKTFNKAFVMVFSQSEFYDGLINQDDFVQSLQKRIVEKKFSTKNHNQFEILLYMFTNPSSYKIKEVYERYSYKFPEESKQQLRVGSQSKNDVLVQEIKSFCTRYGILL